MSETDNIPDSWGSSTMWACEGIFDWNLPMEINCEGNPPTWSNQIGYITKASFTITNAGK